MSPIFHQIIIIALAPILLLLSSCQPQKSTVTSANPAPVWHTGPVIAQAYQTYAPALGVTTDGWLAIWVQGDRLALRTIAADGTQGETSTLPPGRQPWHPVLLSGANDQWHLLWFDLDSYDEPYLYSALLSADGTLLRGPITVTSEPACAAAVAPGEQGSAMIIWSDTKAVPSLYGQSLDSQGRPNSGPATLVSHNAEAPMLNRMADGTWMTGWLAFPDTPGQPSHSRTPTIRYTDGISPWEGTAATVTLDPITLPSLTEYIEQTALGVDDGHGYFFISTRSAETGQTNSRALVFPLRADDPAVTIIEDLSLPATPPDNSATIETGFNTGFALPADEQPSFSVAWPTPLYGQSNVLPVAFNMAGQLTIGYFSNGGMIGYQPLTTTKPILGAPGLWVDRERHLTIGTATYPNTANTPANLLLTSTRPELQPESNP